MEIDSRTEKSLNFIRILPLWQDFRNRDQMAGGLNNLLNADRDGESKAVAESEVQYR